MTNTIGTYAGVDVLLRHPDTQFTINDACVALKLSGVKALADMVQPKPTDLPYRTEWRLLTRKERRAIASHRCKGVSVPRVEQYIDALATSFRQCAHNIRMQREERRMQIVNFNGCKRNLERATFRRRYTMPRKIRTTAEIATMLDGDKRHQIARCISPKFQNGSVEVHWTSGLDQTRIAIDYHDEANGYGKRIRYAKRIWKVDVYAQYLTRAELPGGSYEQQGLVTLAAEQMPSPDGNCRMWSARWLAPARGVDWHVRDGFILESSSGDIIHGESVRSCLSTWRRRRTSRQSVRVARTCHMSVDTLVSKHGDVVLNWRLARRAGLCADGIRAWARQHFPDRNPETDTVTVREAIATGTESDLVIATIAKAIRKPGLTVS